MIQLIAQALKAVFAFVVSGLGALQVALVGGESINHLTSGQWITVVSTAVIAAGGVYGIANRSPGDQGEQESRAVPPPVEP